MTIQQGMEQLLLHNYDPYAAQYSLGYVLWRTYPEQGARAFMLAMPNRYSNYPQLTVKLEIIGAHPNRTSYHREDDPALQYDDWILCKVTKVQDQTTYTPVKDIEI